jgi:hypothetical protein
MMKKILQSIKQFFSSTDNSNQGRNEPKQKVRVFCPKGLMAFFFKDIVIVAPDARAARRQYEAMLKKEIKLRLGESMQNNGTN